MDISLIKNLTEIFKSFPGIGERQAKRFVYFLLSKDTFFIEKFSSELIKLKLQIRQCKECFRYFFIENDTTVCSICADKKRDTTLLMIVEKDFDLEAIEKTKTFNGTYFILGGLVPIVEKHTPSYVRINELKKKIQKQITNGEIKEIILAFSMNPSGDHTDMYIRLELESFLDKGIKISSLGKGLSTGSELEYADKETLKYAMKNRV